MKLKEKEWKDIPNYIGIYQINNLGDIKSLDRQIVRKNNTIQNFKSKKISESISSNGYKSVSLCKNGKSRMYNIHSLLCLSFIDKEYILKKLTVNHIDGNKLNNCFSNLEIITYSENNKHAIKTKLRNLRERKNTKFDESKIIEIKKDLENKNYVLLKDLCLKYNISFSYLSQIKNNKRAILY